MSAGAADFRLASGASGQVALVWQRASGERVDMWYGVYDPTLGTWSQPQQLTADGSMERGMAPVYDAAGDVVVAYNKVQIEYETRTILVGELEIEVEVPIPGQVDLYALRHTIGGDLAIGPSDIVIDPPNPLPGTEATISATIHNIGDVPATDIEVAFYDGDPGNDGVLINTEVIQGPLVGGDTAEGSVAWTVPASIEPHDIYVIIDPNLQQEDRDRTNNSAFHCVLAPDLMISEIGVQSAGPDRLLTIRVANEGVLTVGDAEVTLRRDSVTGPVLAILTVPEIVPGAYHDLSYRWETPAPAKAGGVMVYAIADEADAIHEFDETDNTRCALVPVEVLEPGIEDVEGAVEPDDVRPVPPP
jgi:hypothetical protein